MLTRSEATNSEEFIFYLDLIGNFMKRKTLIKAINNFIKEKAKFNVLSSYGLVIFQKDNNPVNIYDLNDSETVLDTINDMWDSREREQSYLENGLYEILAYIFRKSRETRKNYRIIIISDTPSNLSEDYYNALYDLLIKAKKFFTFIDIIRVGTEKFYEDDVKLKVISSETQGGMFYCQDEKLLQTILGSLVQNKREFKVIKTEEPDQILQEDKIFYERLAVDLISLSSDDEEICTICEQELCPICEAHSDEIHKCYNCGAKFHNCCAAKYSLAKNIGFNHIFRCPQCDTLLKLDEEFVNIVYEEDLEEKLLDIDLTDGEIEESFEGKLKQKEVIEEVDLQEQNIEQEEESIEITESLPPPPSEPTKRVKVGGFFGKEIEIKLKKETSLQTQIPNSINKPEKPISITKLKPPKKKTIEKIKLCKICGTTIKNATICPTCGAKLD
ncbi:MAG: hypothetical protein ACFFHD_06805 [Promethearchaeota archaeon]